MWGAGAVALVATAGCNPFSPTTRITQTVTAAPAAAADVLPTLIATTRLHLVRLTNAIAGDRSLAGRLTPLRADRQAHLTALIDELGRSSPVAAAAEKKKPTADKAVAVPTGGPAALLVGMRADAALAQSTFTDAMAQTSRYRAALFASIAACLASHRVALA
jgi:hypothetical protein